MRIHSAQRNDGYLCKRRHEAETHWAQCSGTGMRSCGEDRAQHYSICAQSVGKCDVTQIMRGGNLQHIMATRIECARRAINSVRPPLARGQCAVCQNHFVPARFGEMAQMLETRPAFRPIQMVMAIDKARSARQPHQCVIQHGVIARIRNQPQHRQGLFICHAAVIARG